MWPVYYLQEGAKHFHLKTAFQIVIWGIQRKKKKSEKISIEKSLWPSSQSDVNYSRETGLQVPATGSLSFSASNDNSGSQEGGLAVPCLKVANKPAQFTLYFNL